jgi:hypothetical protein
MTITVNLHPSWHLPSVFAALARIEQQREPGEDLDDLSELLAGMDEPESPAPAAPAVARPSPAPQPSPAASPPAREWDGVPRTGKGLYKWATTRKALPAVNRIGRQFNYPKLVSDWADHEVAAAYAILTAEPAANGAAR